MEGIEKEAAELRKLMKIKGLSDYTKKKNHFRYQEITDILYGLNEPETKNN